MKKRRARWSRAAGDAGVNNRWRMGIQLIGGADIGDGKKRRRICGIVKMRRTLCPCYHHTSALWLMEAN